MSGEKSWPCHSAGCDTPATYRGPVGGKCDWCWLHCPGTCYVNARADDYCRGLGLEEAAKLVEAPPVGVTQRRHKHRFTLWGFTPRSFQDDLAAAIRALKVPHA